MRRAHVAVVVATTLMITGCSVEQRPLRRGFALDETTGPTTTSTSAGATAKAAPATPTSTSPSPSSGPSAKARPAAELAALALPQPALTEDGLDVRESAAAAPSVAETVCGKPLTVPGRAPDGYRVSTRSQSGASKLEQRVTGYPEAEVVVDAARKALTCPETALQLSGVDDAVAWCEALPGGRGACTTVLAKDDLAITLRMETISVERATEVTTRLAAAAAGLLAQA
ncbi:hypothetical protein [Umezawaea tangerina]|uniref:DUF3558 domain-containing protein n=1 Tax=Umezawaea tangerina TaxID=84725 RepID=A0A2T0SXN1_9PSEU|nr:hypothetical protein [Umezawaea tangerina]PRY38149.1 hypothetical protein CLV43_109369 [Umezawaea tangerina]